MRSDSLVRCRDVIDELVDQSTVVTLAHRHHLERCDGCRGEVAALRQLRDDLRGLRSQPLDVSADLAVAIVARIDAEASSPARRAAWLVRAAPYVGGVVAATAAGAALAGRRRLRTL